MTPLPGAEPLVLAVHTNHRARLGVMNEVQKSVYEKGYSPVEFGMTLRDRRELARLGNIVIDIAQADPDIYEALAHDTFPDKYDKNITAYMVSEPQVSHDDSIWFHSGWQTTPQVFAELSQSKRPADLMDFLELQQQALTHLDNTWQSFLDQLQEGEEPDQHVSQTVTGGDSMGRNHHIRIVRYNNVAQTAKETFSAHGDLSVVSAQVFETHHRHMQAAPYPLGMVADSVDEARYRHAVDLHERSQPLDIHLEEEVAAFLGFGAANIRTPSGNAPLLDFSAAYHFGQTPEGNPALDDKIAADFGDDVRVAVIGFGHPHLSTPLSQYWASCKEACRPEQVFEGNIKPSA